MVNSIFSSFIVLKDIIIIMIFYYTLFAITGVQIFGGNLKYNCYDVNTVYIINKFINYRECYKKVEMKNFYIVLVTRIVKRETFVENSTSILKIIF